MAETFRCTLVTPEKQVIDEPVLYASIPAWDGQLGVAHLRAPLVCKLGDGPLRLDMPDGSRRWYFLGGGFAQVKDDKLALLTPEAVAAEDVVRDETRGALARAMAEVAIDDEAVERERRAMQRGRVLSELASPKR